jgi:hypothetical protein
MNGRAKLCSIIAKLVDGFFQREQSVARTCPTVSKSKQKVSILLWEGDTGCALEFLEFLAR